MCLPVYDARNWLRRDAVFMPLIIIGNVMPDEHMVLELGPRAAVARLQESLAYDKSPQLFERPDPTRSKGEQG